MQLMKQFLFLPAQFTEYCMYNAYVMFLLTYYVISIFFFLHTSHWSFIIAPSYRPTCTVKVYSTIHRCRRDCNWFLASIRFIYQSVYNRDSKLKALVRSVAPPYAMNNICEAQNSPSSFPFFPLSLANTLACVSYASSKCMCVIAI